MDGRQPTVAYLTGARPNFVKLAPVVLTLRERLPDARHLLIHTEQHYDREMSDVFLEALGMPEPDYVLGVGSGTHGAQTGRALARVEDVLLRERPDALVVPGDVNSTLAGALAAVKLQIPVAHVESGLRSYDDSMPEEINRVLVDRVARWCFTHSPEAAANLRREGIPPRRIHFVGNTMIDSLVRMLPLAEASTVHERLALEPGAYVLATLHRPNLVDGALLEPMLAALGRLGRWHPVVFPVHPRVRTRIERLRTAAELLLTPPLDYLEFLALESHAAAVVTDSGGVQEETSYLGVPCFTVRENTERPITLAVGTNTLLGLDPSRLAQIPGLVETRRRPQPIVGWDGRASERLADVLEHDLSANLRRGERRRPLPAPARG